MFAYASKHPLRELCLHIRRWLDHLNIVDITLNITAITKSQMTDVNAIVDTPCSDNPCPGLGASTHRRHVQARI